MSVFRKTFFYFTGCLGRMLRILFLRDWDAICEEGGKEDTLVGGDGGGGDVVEGLIIAQ